LTKSPNHLEKAKHNRLLVQNTLTVLFEGQSHRADCTEGVTHSHQTGSGVGLRPSSSSSTWHCRTLQCKLAGAEESTHREEETTAENVKCDLSLLASLALRSKAALHPCPIGLGSTLQILHSSVRHGQPATPTRPLLRCIHSTPRLFSSLLAGCTTARRERLRSFAQRLFRHSLNSGNE
jgi:hypothetical protein